MATVPELTGDDSPNFTPASLTPISEAMQQANDSRRQGFVDTLQTVAPINPDQYASAAKASRSTGIPADVLNDNHDLLKQLQRTNQYQGLYDKNRRTAEALSNGQTAAIAQDDIDQLRRIEDAKQIARFDKQSTGEKLWGSIKQAFQASDQGSDLAYADRLERLRGSLDRVDQEVASATLEGRQPYASGGTPTGFAYEYLNLNPEDRQAMRDRLLGRQAGAITDAVATQKTITDAPVEPGALRYQELGGDASAMVQAIAENPGYAARAAVGSIATSAPMLVAGALGGPLAAGAVELGTEYDAKLVDVLREAKVNLNDPKAVLAALQDDNLMETARLKASRKAIGTTAIDVLGMTVAGKLLVPKAIGGRALTTTQREATNLAVQFPVQGALGGLSEAAGQYLADGKVSGGDVVMEVVAGAAASSIDVAVFGGDRVMRNISEGLAKSRQARQGKQTLDEMVSAAQESKTRNRDPETFNEITATQLRDSDIESISIPAEALAKLNQDGAPPVLDELLAQVTGLGQQYAEAQASGGSVMMKTADYLTHFAQYHDQLSNSIRTQVDGLSIEESQQWQEGQVQQIEELAATMTREPDARDDAFMGMMAELQQAGYRAADAEQYATVHLAAMATLAERSGKTLQDVMQRFPLEVRTQAPEAIQRIPVDDMRIAIRRLRTGDIPEARTQEAGADLTPEQRQSNARVAEQRQTLTNLGEYLDQLGVNLNELGDDQVLNILRDPESIQGVQLNQQGVTKQQFLDGVLADYPGLKLDLAGNSRTLTLSRIVVPEGSRQAGTGSAVMQRLIDWADANQKAVALTPSADFGGNKKRLGEFYKRFGFVENKGKNKDYEISEAMYREPRLNQTGSEKQPRGYIDFNQPPRGDQRKFQITVTGRRDLSTLLHEFGHFYLEVVADLALDADANPQMVADVQAIRQWTGAAESGPFEVAQHEQFARGFEAYLAEGKAPNPELQGAFSRFKRWIIAIYKDLRRLNVELTPEIRGVMDRIVATDQQIRDAELVTQAVPMFDTAEKAGMTEAEFLAYREQVELAHDEAQTAVEQQIIREEERRRSKWWSEEKARVTDEVSEELDTIPAYQAMRALRSGVLPDGSPTTMKLSTSEIQEQYGIEVLRKLSFMHAKRNGAPMDVVASGLGFTSGDEMIKAMLSMPPRAEYLASEVNTRMEERHGAKSTGEAAERAMDAVHNEKHGAVLLRELNALGKRGNRNNITSQQVMRMAAERIMQERKVRNIQPYEYQRAEGTAGRKAFEAAARGDLVAAYEAKQQQLLNYHLWREAKKARENIDIIVDRMAGFNKTSRREKLGKAGHDYLDQIDAVMEQYEFRTVSLRDLDRRKSFAGWYADQVAAGNDPVVPEFILNNSRKINYKDLSLAQLDELDEFVQNVNHLAGLKNKLTANKRIRDLKEGQELLAKSAFDNVDKLPTRQIVANARSLSEVTMEWLKKGNSSLLKMEQVIEWLDGGNANGAWSTLVFQPLAEAQHNRDRMNKEITKRVVDLTNQWFKERGSTVGKIFKVSSLEKPMTTNGMLAVALNTGNASNHQKLLKGYGWEQHTVDEILSHMTQADWRYVEQMWETVESLWPSIVDLEKRVNGVAPPKIEGLTIQTPWGEVKGGYWPLVYDPLSTKYADVEKSLGSLAPLNESGTVKATPPRGHTKARVDGFAAPILLDVGVIGNHLQGVIHDITHREALNDAHRLLKGEAREAMTQTVGPELAAQFINMLDGIASDQASGDSKAISALSKVMSTLRSNQAAAWMGYSVTTVMNQLGGYPQALDYFAQKGGRKHMYRALVKYWGNPLENGRMIRAMSGEMENRALNLDASIREAQRDVIRMKDGRFVQDAFKGMLNGRDAMVKYAFVPIQVMQSVVDNVVWMAGYEMEGGALNHEQAVAGADRAVRLTQTAGGAKDMATIQQSNMAKLFMPVYGYASLLWNRNVDIARDASRAIKNRSPKDVLVAFERFVYLNILPTLLAGAIKGDLPGQGDDDDDDETWAGWLAVQSLLGVSSGVPLAGTIAQGFFGDYGYAGASAIGQGFDAAIKASNSAEGQTITTQAVSAVGAFTGLPASQINRSVRTGFMVEDGQMDDSAQAIIRGVLFGPPSNK